MQRIKKGDTVMVISGPQKGTTGEVLRVIPKDNKAVVQGVNVKTKHNKPSMTNPNGGIVKAEAPVDLSNLMPVEPTTQKPTRVSVKVLESGEKVRAAAKGGEQF